MYASYNMLYKDCGLSAQTDQTRFFCSSLPVQKQVRKSIQTAEFFPMETPCVHKPGGDISKDANCNYTQHKTKETFTSPTTTTKPSVVKHTSLLGQDQNKLLPVMDPAFNLREICKQCILLEDHLCHDEKRCFDCCVKHFLTIEALAEEAITLDQSCSYSDKLQKLPSRVRQLQSQWHEDPDNNAQNVSQELRKIRKDFQLGAFDVVFRSNASCEGGVCKINTRQSVGKNNTPIEALRQGHK